MVLTKQLTLILIMVIQICSEYAGEDFPIKFLDPDGKMPTDSDLNLYLDKMIQITRYMKHLQNKTHESGAIAAFMSRALLKRTLIDYKNQMEDYEDTIKELIFNLTSVTTHFIYYSKYEGNSEKDYRLGMAMQDDTSITHSIKRFRRGVLKGFLFKSDALNDFIPLMDRLSLPKENYMELVQASDADNEMNSYDSGLCLSRLVENIDVLDNLTLHPCKLDKVCKKKIFSGPSVAYILNHRLFNNMMYFFTRRCYHHSVAYDAFHMDMLCAAMYRETVYLARRGFFSRHVFLQHIAICGQLGYEEFHRRAWFHKTVKWIDERGCMQEDSNFEFNKTRALIRANGADAKETRQQWRTYHELMLNECHHHTMAVAMMVLANAIRHAAHFKEDLIS